MLINEKITDARARSVYINGELQCNILVLLLNFSTSGWISISVGEGKSEFNTLNQEPKLLELSEIKDDYAYPTSHLSNISDFIGEKVTSIYEYRLNGISEGCVGIYIEFGDFGFSAIEEEEDCLTIKHGIKDFSVENISLHKIYPNPTAWPNFD